MASLLVFAACSAKEEEKLSPAASLEHFEAESPTLDAFIGKWYCYEEGGATLNVIKSGDVFRLSLSYEDSGFNNVTPSSFYEQDGILRYETSVYGNLIAYAVELKGGELSGTYTQQGEAHGISFIKLSEKPDDKPFIRVAPFTYYKGVPRLDILRKYADFSTDSDDPPYSFEYALDEKLPDIIEEYGYSEYMSSLDADGDNLAFSIMDFVCDNFSHFNAAALPLDHSLEGVVKYCSEHDGKTNCRGLSIILAGLLRANGIEASHITCLPFEDNFTDCHVVVDCILPSGKRVMLDPTYRLHLKDSEGEHVSVRRLREILIEGGAVYPNEGAGYNGEAFTEVYYRAYMAKNLFRLERALNSCDGDDYSSQFVQLCPAGFDPADDGITVVRSADDFWADNKD
jgi:hypothetical protein